MRLPRLRLPHSHIVVDAGSRNVRMANMRTSRILVEANCVAHTASGDALVVGSSAVTYLDRTPSTISVTWPTQQGVIDAYELAEELQRRLLRKIGVRSKEFWQLCSVLLVLPDGMNGVARRTAIETVIGAGARRVFSVSQSESISQSIATGGRNSETIVIDLGAATTTLTYGKGRAKQHRSIGWGSDNLTETIIQHARDEYGMLIDWERAEVIKHQLALGVPSANANKNRWVEAKSTVSGLPVKRHFEVKDFADDVVRDLRNLVDFIRVLLSDVQQGGGTAVRPSLLLIGGGAALGGLDEYLQRELKVPTSLKPGYDTALVEGAAELWSGSRAQQYVVPEVVRWQL